MRGDGSSAKPLRTLSAALASSGAGVQVHVRAGVYRESVTLTQGGQPGDPQQRVMIVADPRSNSVLLRSDNPGRAAFDNDVVGKSPAALKSLWTQNVFTGKAVPPKKLGSDDEVKKAVAATKGAVGYIKAGSADDTVKVITH